MGRLSPRAVSSGKRVGSIPARLGFQKLPPVFFKAQLGEEAGAECQAAVVHKRLELGQTEEKEVGKIPDPCRVIVEQITGIIRRRGLSWGLQKDNKNKY